MQINGSTLLQNVVYRTQVRFDELWQASKGLTKENLIQYQYHIFFFYFGTSLAIWSLTITVTALQ